MDYNPHTNENVIAIIKQEDGNYIGEMQKFGKVIKVREMEPQAVVVALLTHSGE